MSETHINAKLDKIKKLATLISGRADKSMASLRVRPKTTLATDENVPNAAMKSGNASPFRISKKRDSRITSNQIQMKYA